MQQEILDKLAGLEDEHDVEILYACESGSRAWGFASPDSDYDVRFIYKHKLPRYISLENLRDVIEIPVNEVLDINGWDIKKALKLFRGSNCPLYEWLQSPIIYRSQQAFTDTILPLMNDYFSLRAGCHHYLSMAKNTFHNELQGETVRLKKYFYALRPILAAMWIVEKGSLPPMEFGILRTLVTDVEWQKQVGELMAAKQVATEKETISRIDFFNAFVEKGIQQCDAAAVTILPKETGLDDLNAVFRKLIYDAGQAI